MSSPPFVHLHVHSEYSLLESTLRAPAIVDLAAAMGMPAVAMTDRSNLFGAVEFFTAGKAKGINAILGCELNLLMEGHMADRSGRRGMNLAHLVVLVENHAGYQNLCRLLSEAYLKGFYYKPRVDWETLGRYADGLIALTGCSHGPLGEVLRAAGDRDRAVQVASRLAAIFPDRLYIELQRNGRPGQEGLLRDLVKIGKSLSLPLVATNDCHYATRDGASAQEVLLCIESGKTLDDFDHEQMPSDEFYFKSAEEMADLFADHPDAIENTARIAARCAFAFDFKTYHFPKFAVPDEKSLDEVLSEKAKHGLETRLAAMPSERISSANKQQIYWDRLHTELDVIGKMGFAGYFLIVADFIQHAKAEGIPVGPGRGSAAGSLVAYALDITDLDPLPYHLLFERFLNPERISMPDVDIDFCMRRRGEVIQYVAKKYGSVSQIITFGKMKAKAAVRDVARVLNFPYAEADKIAKLIPNALNMTLSDALKQEPALRELIEKTPKVKRLIGLAQEIEGLSRHASTHAAGVVISDRNLSEFAPLYRGTNEDLVTQYDMKAVEKIGLIKFDFLGLTTLTIMEDCLENIRRSGTPVPHLPTLPLDDAEVYKTLSAGDTIGVFQLESSGMRELIIKLAPTTFEDLIALVALYRPGPLGSGMVDDFIDRKHGRKTIVSLLPELDDILRDTYGVIVYQEQVMQIAARLASYSLGEADILRRAMGKKKPEEMAAQKKRFLEGAAANRIPTAKATHIFDLMEKFAEYGFNKSHSAAYALIAYQTAYLKTHHRTAFMASFLTSVMSDSDRVLRYIRDCKDAKIEILPPDVNESVWEFANVGDHAIRYGLGAIKNVGASAVEAIVQSRTPHGPFRDLYDFTSRIDLSRANHRVLESLIAAGACDSFGTSRRQLEGELDRALDMGAKTQTDQLLGQTSLFDAFCGTAQPTSKTDAAPSSAEEWPLFEKLSREKAVLGFYLSGHPLREYRHFISDLACVPIASLASEKTERDVAICGIPNTIKEIQTKKGTRMAFVSCEDLSGHIELTVFSDVYDKAREHLNSGQPLFISGKLDIGDEQVKLLATAIEDLADYTASRATALHITLKPEMAKNGHLPALQRILRETPGRCPTYIHYTEQNEWESVVRLGIDYAVAPSAALFSQLHSLFGETPRLEFRK